MFYNPVWSHDPRTNLIIVEAPSRLNNYNYNLPVWLEKYVNVFISSQIQCFRQPSGTRKASQKHLFTTCFNCIFLFLSKNFTSKYKEKETDLSRKKKILGPLELRLLFTSLINVLGTATFISHSLSLDLRSWIHSIRNCLIIHMKILWGPSTWSKYHNN